MNANTIDVQTGASLRLGVSLRLAWQSILRAYPDVYGYPRLHDPAEDGTEIDLIQFFRHHPRGLPRGISACLHIKGNECDLDS